MAPSRSSNRRSMAPLPTELSPLSRLAIKAGQSSRRRSVLGLAQPGRSSSGTPGRQKSLAANGSAKTNRPESRRSLVSVGVASNSWDDPISPSCQLSGSQGLNLRPGDVTSLSVHNMDLESPSLLSKSHKTALGNTTSHSVREMEFDSPNLPRPGTPTMRPGVSSHPSLERLMLPADTPSPRCQDQASLLLPTDTPSPANQALVLDSDDDDDMLSATQRVDNRVLKDVIVYVEVRCNDTMENRSKAVARQLELLGAQVEPKLTREVTHVVFKDGKKSTLDRAIKKGVHLVSVLWVESCREKQIHVNEGLYPISRPDEGSTPVLTRIRRYRSMQPKSFEEELAGSAERVRKRRRHHELANRWKTVTGTTPSNTPGKKATVYVEDTQDPNSEEMILPDMPLAIPDTPPNMREMRNQLMARQETQASPHNSEKAMSQKRLFEADHSSICEKKSSAVSRPVAKDNQQVSTDTVSGRNSQPRMETSCEGGKKPRRQSRRLSSLPAKDGEQEGSTSLQQSGKSGSGKRRLLSTMNSGPSMDLIHPQEPTGSVATNRVKKTVGVLSGKRDQTPVSTSTVSRAGVESQGKGTDPDVQSTSSKRIDSDKENAAAKRKWRATTDSSDVEDEQVAKKGKQVETDNVVGDRGSKPVKAGAALPHWDWDSDSSDGLGELAARASARALASLRQGSKKKNNLSNRRGSNDESDSDDPNSKQTGWKKTPEKKSNKTKQNQKANRKARGKSLGAMPVEEDAEVVDLASSQYSVVEPLRPSRRSLEEFAPPQRTSLSRRSCKKGKDSSRCSSKRVRSSSGSSNSSGGAKDLLHCSTKSARMDKNKQAQRQAKSTRNRTSSDLDSSTSSSSTGATRLSCNRRQKAGKKEKPGRALVMTSMHTKDQELLISVVKELEGFHIERDVTERTTHVVSGSNRRTLNVLSAVARGCWLVSLEWVLKSCEVGRYVEEEPYELHEAFPAAQESRLERQAAEGPYKQDLFSDCGLIYISEQTSPPHASLVRLVELCGGRISTSIRRARIVVGNPRRRTDALVVTELWVLDSITEHRTLPLDDYLVQPEKTRRASSPEF
ncbi:MCPH1 [Branchiostoma lanceolatum]|uniref:MCPH1 protein n=1 Tax=Branchiostoma lanceolatum TaxID=7740 RepID=A0A8K0EJR1_BRALA|nr:MCPH1 [Branchiostoma lanceolatum]